MNHLATKIMMVDDHTIFVESLTLLFDTIEDVHLVKTASSVDEALPLIEELMLQRALDIVIVDMRMPTTESKQSEREGIRCAKAIQQWNRSSLHKIKIIVLSGYEDGRLVHMARRAGVHGYLSKNCGSNIIMQAIRIVKNGGQYYQDILAQNEARFLAEHPGFGEEEIDLSNKDQQLLQLISQGKRDQDIAHLLQAGLSSVERWKKNLKQTFQVTTIPELIHKATALGFLDSD